VARFFGKHKTNKSAAKRLKVVKLGHGRWSLIRPQAFLRHGNHKYSARRHDRLTGWRDVQGKRILRNLKRLLKH